METNKCAWCSSMDNEVLRNSGLLLFRLVLGLFMLQHGWQKITHFESMSALFPDPIGIGATASLVLIIFAEFGCSLLVIFGLFTRLATIPLMIGMIVAGFIILAKDPFAVKELPFLYLGCYFVLAFLGSGKYSLDHVLSNLCSKHCKRCTSSANNN